MQNFKKWLMEARTPFRTLQEINPNEFLVACDFLEDEGWSSKHLDNNQNLCYIKPLIYTPRILISRFKNIHFLVKRMNRGRISSSTFYDMYPCQFLEDFCNFLHISPKRHIGNDIATNSYDYVTNMPNDVLENIAKNTLEENPELFQGNLSGRNHVDRSRLNNVWDYDHFHSIAKFIPQNKGNFATAGSLEIMKKVIEWLTKRWGNISSIRPEWLIERVP